MPDNSDNVLYYGDNLDVLRRHVDDKSVDLVYLDPPFNSNADYNVLFAEQDGSRAAAQILAFGNVEFPRLQVVTVEELLNGGRVQMPGWHESRTFRRAPKVKGKGHAQHPLPFDQT